MLACAQKLGACSHMNLMLRDGSWGHFGAQNTTTSLCFSPWHARILICFMSAWIQISVLYFNHTILRDFMKFIIEHWPICNPSLTITRLQLAQGLWHQTPFPCMSSVGSGHKTNSGTMAGIAGLVPCPHAPPGKKRSSEQSWISWAYYTNMVMTNEIARSVVIT